MRFLTWLTEVPATRRADGYRRLTIWAGIVAVMFGGSFLSQQLAGDSSGESLVYAARNALIWAVVSGVWLVVRFYLYWRDQRRDQVAVRGGHTRS